MENVNILEFIVRFFFWISPVVFAVGIMLLLSFQEYQKIEELLGREIGGIRKKVLPKLEGNINTLQNWMINNRIVVGIVLIGYFVVFWVLFGMKANIL